MAMKTQWHSVVFIDLDGTVMEGPFESAVFPIILTELSKKSGLSLDQVRRMVVKENFRRQKDPETPVVLAMDWDDIIQTVAKELDVTLPENIVLEIVTSHACPPYSNTENGAKEVLTRLASPHRALVAATKGLKKYQLPVLEALTLTSLFDDILTPDTHNALKKDIAFYGQWPELTNVQIIVGDHYEDDVEAPKNFGFRTVWKPRASNGEVRGEDPFVRPLEFVYLGRYTVYPDAIIASLQELPKVVTVLETQDLYIP